MYIHLQLRDMSRRQLCRGGPKFGSIEGKGRRRGAGPRKPTEWGPSSRPTTPQRQVPTNLPKPYVERYAEVIWYLMMFDRGDCGLRLVRWGGNDDDGDDALQGMYIASVRDTDSYVHEHISYMSSPYLTQTYQHAIHVIYNSPYRPYRFRMEFLFLNLPNPCLVSCTHWIGTETSNRKTCPKHDSHR